MQHRLLYGVLLLNISWACHADTLRCNSQLVSQEDPMAEVQAKCGEPIERAVLGYKETLDRYGFRQEVEVEEWTYGPDHGMYRTLRFEGRRLKKIESYRSR